MGVGVKGKSFSLNKAQRQRHSSPNLHSTAILQQKPRAKQTVSGELSLVFAGSITNLEIMVQTQKGFLNTVLLHQLTRLF